jgi:putative hydrolase of the HAD superfamily
MNPFTSVQAVTFDVGGTLIQPWPSVGHVYAEVAAKHGVKELSPASLNSNFATAWRARRNFNHTSEDWAALVDSTFAGMVETSTSQSFFPAIYQRFAEVDAWRIYEDVLPAFDALASKGILLAVVSNWDERLRPLLKQLRLESYLETIVVSSEVAFTKPSPVIFELAAQKLGVPPDQILHVGDSVREDWEGARSAGFEALLVNREVASLDERHIASLHDLERLVRVT